MKSVLHLADTRGHFKYSWLNTYHTFSFADYHDPERVHFGMLRVLNDDVIEAGQGFGTHPHENMEIVTIPLRGDLEHKDSTGNSGIIKTNDVQVMSAGTGIYHSEYNPNPDKDVNLLQIWVFPKERNIKPRYAQATFDRDKRLNKFQVVVSPDKEGLWINQDAWFSLARIEKGKSLPYQLHKEDHGIYLFVIEGKAVSEYQHLNRRDGYGLWELDHTTIKAEDNLEILVIEVPMN